MNELTLKEILIPILVSFFVSVIMLGIINVIVFFMIFNSGYGDIRAIKVFYTLDNPILVAVNLILFLGVFVASILCFVAGLKFGRTFQKTLS